MYYFYDKTFIGFLSLVYEVFLRKDSDFMIMAKGENSLFDGIHVETSIEKAEKVYNVLEKSIGNENLEKVFSTFLSERLNIEQILINYIKQGLKYKEEIYKYYSKEVLEVEKTSKKVCHEAHKFKGMLRFRKLLDDTYLAIICPDYDILPLILSHFSNRYSDQNFVIYDEKRKKSIIYNMKIKKAEIKKIIDFDNRLFDFKNFELLHKEEREYISLWKQYFESIGIEDRKNTKLQKSHMSNKYWKNLVEINS